MGRKRNKTSKKDAGPDSVSNRLVELLADLLEVSGVWGKVSNKEDDPWFALALSLEILTEKLENGQSAQLTFDEDGDMLNDHLLLEIESAAQEVRSRADIFTMRIQENSEEVELCHELESVCQKTFPRLRPLSRSLLNALQYRRCAGRDVLQDILLSLSHLHCANDSSLDLILDLKKATRRIRRRCLDSRSSPWKEVIIFLEHFGADIESSNETSDSISATMQHNVQVDAQSNDPTLQFSSKENLHGNNTMEESILCASTVFDAVRAFISHSDPGEQNVFSILLQGDAGSGKTRTCAEIEKMASDHICVIRPSLPFDAMGLTVGSAEDLLISMVAQARTNTKRSILLLDDVESICGQIHEGSSNPASAPGAEPHLMARMRGVLLSLLDLVHQGGKRDQQLLVVCTSRINLGKTMDRFDRTYILSAPGAAERTKLIGDHMELVVDGESTESVNDILVKTSLSSIVESTSGLSYAELAQYCRDAVLASHQGETSLNWEKAGSLRFLEELKRRLQSAKPASLRSGINADFVDMTIITARDLRKLSAFPTAGSQIEFPMFGKSVESAWRELRRLIVTPICQARALNQLMFDDGASEGKAFSGGVLVTGPPGCGKSALAYYCAAAAASTNPSIKLVNVNCTSLIHKEVGSSERAIHRLFKSTRAAAPCILLLDSIESIAALRGNDNTTEGTMDRVLSTLLTELDGVDNQQFSQENSACLAIIGITHNAEWIDPALRRPGRLERVIDVGFPEYEARRKLALRELRDTNYNSTAIEDLAACVAQATQNFTGAGVIAVCNEAKLLASKDWCDRGSIDNPSLRSEHVIAAIEAQGSYRR